MPKVKMPKGMPPKGMMDFDGVMPGVSTKKRPKSKKKSMKKK